ncbi:hypothetical protein CEP52_014848 [Fusarium oligoseptatum]|uniref:Uncharacterized protein n=1 Tax=Fusarium oligoseptatum TaxID=2604345 RepID=A0A428SIU6_9HYPO|nr:hypothetical protein CEP52_014848 [Fusarium oligoseptatum]
MNGYDDQSERESDEENRLPLHELTPGRPAPALGFYRNNESFRDGEAAHYANGIRPLEHELSDDGYNDDGYNPRRFGDVLDLIQDLEAMNPKRSYNRFVLQFEEAVKEALSDERSTLLDNIARENARLYLTFRLDGNSSLFHNVLDHRRLVRDIQMILHAFQQLNIVLRQMAMDFSDETPWIGDPVYLRHTMLLLGTLVSYLCRVLPKLGFTHFSGLS